MVTYTYISRPNHSTVHLHTLQDAIQKTLTKPVSFPTFQNNDTVLQLIYIHVDIKSQCSKISYVLRLQPQKKL